MRTQVNPWDYAGAILGNIQAGVLLNSRMGDKINVMTIGWGVMGTDWRRPVFVTFVREHRFTRECLESCPEFTVCAPLGDYDKKAAAFAGSVSGRDVDKISKLGLHIAEPEKVSVPGLREFPLTLECRILYSQAQEPTRLPQDIQDELYPQDKDSSHPRANRDRHIAYYGEIVASYIIS